MISVSILTVVGGLLLLLVMGVGRAARVQEAQVTTQDDARSAMRTLEREVREAARSSINWANLPGRTLTFRQAEDVDGNGTAVDVGINLELGPVVQVFIDTADLNGDRQTTSQLLMVEGNRITVLASDIRPDEDANNNNVLDAGEDRDNNGRLDRGVLFAPRGTGIVMQIQTQRRSDPQGPLIRSELQQIVVPRN